ncbi:MAG: oligosaccharide flippase family protein [Fimbriimonadaceae bacterium]|nr:oligosaccharide flippase family protein [Fimbriimonadaceae bacterium]
MAENSNTDPRGDEEVSGQVKPEDLPPESVTEGILLETPAADVTSGPAGPVNEQVENITKMDRRAVERGFAWTAFFSIFSKVLFPLAGLYVSRHLGPAIMGISGMLLQIISLSEVLRDAGLSQSYMVEHNLDRKRLGSYMSMSLLMGIIPAVLLVAFTPFMADFFRTPELLYALPIVAGLVLLNSATTIPAAKMLKEGRIKEQGMIGVIASGIALATCIVMVRLGYGFVSIMTQIVVASVIANTVMFLRSPVTVFHWSRAAFAENFRRSGALLAANGINNLFLQADLFVIARMIDKTATGLYNTAQNVAYKPADLISFPLAKVLMVAFGQSTKDLDKLATNFTRAITAVVLFVTPIYLVIGFCSDAIIWLLYADKFVGAITTMSILSIYLGVRTLGNVAGHALVPAGKHAWTLYPWILAVAVTIAGLFLTYRPTHPHYSLETIVWCFTAGALCVYIIIVGVAFHFLRPKGPEVGRLKKSIWATLATGVLIGVIHYLPIGMYERFGLTVAIAPVFHFILIGMLFDGKWNTYLNRRGPKQLLRKL